MVSCPISFPFDDDNIYWQMYKKEKPPTGLRKRGPGINDKMTMTAPSPFPSTMQVDSEHKHIPSRKPQKDLQPMDLDEKLTALRRTAG